MYVLHRGQNIHPRMYNVIEFSLNKLFFLKAIFKVLSVKDTNNFEDISISLIIFRQKMPCANRSTYFISIKKI